MQKKVIVSPKDCTKKEWKALMASRRSQVGLSQNLGTRTHSKGSKADRADAKAQIRAYY